MMRILIKGKNAIERIHDLVGNTDPRTSPIGTIRALSRDSVKQADQEGRAVRNLAMLRDLKRRQHEIFLFGLKTVSLLYY